MEYLEIGLCCDDCAIAIANDDYTGMDDGQEQRTRDGIRQTCEDNGAHTGLVLGESQGFTWRSCHICGNPAGNRYLFGASI